MMEFRLWCRGDETFSQAWSEAAREKSVCLGLGGGDGIAGKGR